MQDRRPAADLRCDASLARGVRLPDDLAQADSRSACMDCNEKPSEALPAGLIFTMPEPNLCGDSQSFGICGPGPVQGG